MKLVFCLVIIFMIKCRKCIVFARFVSCKFDGRCVCLNDTIRLFINVSWREISKIPTFPSTVYSTNLSNNKIGKILNGVFIKQINLGKLDLTLNYLKELEIDSFKGLSNLHELVLEKKLYQLS